MFLPSPIDPVTADSIERKIDAGDKTDNCVFPTPWEYKIELRTDNAEESHVDLVCAHGHDFASYSGDCDGAQAFIESAHAMEESHQLLDTCQMLLKVLVQDCDAEAFGSEISHAEGVIADAERA